MGFPIRKFTDQRLLPPPRDLSQGATSFIAFLCQGIHRMPLKRLFEENRRTQGKAPFPEPCPKNPTLPTLLLVAGSIRVLTIRNDFRFDAISIRQALRSAASAGLPRAPGPAAV